LLRLVRAQKKAGCEAGILTTGKSSVGSIREFYHGSDPREEIVKIAREYSANIVHFHAAAESLQPAIVEAGFATVVHVRGLSVSGLSSYVNPIFVSKSHANNHGRQQFVYNGIDPDSAGFEPHAEAYLSFLGKVRRSKKGASTAVAVAKRTGRKLKLAGGRKFKIPQTWLPFQKTVETLGVLGHNEKMAMLGKSSALLFPIRWEEPFGLVLIEAMAVGTPVIAFSRGAVSEIVDHEVTGFVVQTYEQMCDAVDRISEIDREACRRHVVENFSIDATASAMMGYYERALDGEIW
jgi:glycosyltransferase involved in cell wall biosynthesis